MKPKVVFLDRDGVINTDPKEKYYVHKWEEFEFIPGAILAVKELCNKGYKVFVISNQAGVGKGEVAKEDLYEITRRMLEAFEKEGVKLHGVFYCTHKPDENCCCRKPKTALYEEALVSLKLQKGDCYLVGDSERDIVAGKSFGCRNILVLTGRSKASDAEAFSVKPDVVLKDLGEAVRWILASKTS